MNDRVATAIHQNPVHKTDEQLFLRQFIFALSASTDSRWSKLVLGAKIDIAIQLQSTIRHRHRGVPAPSAYVN